jgi:hypothetical protein
LTLKIDFFKLLQEEHIEQNKHKKYIVCNIITIKNEEASKDVDTKNTQNVKTFAPWK